MRKDVKGVPLLTIAILAVCVACVASVVIWTSPNLSFTVTVGGNLDAFVNVDWPTDIEDYPDRATLEIRCDSVMHKIDATKASINIIPDPSSNLDSLWIENLVVNGPAGCSSTAEVFLQQYSGDALAIKMLVGTIATDGTQSLKLWVDGLDDAWPYGTVIGGRYRAVIIEVSFFVPGEIGNYPFSATVSLGDGI